MSDIYKQQDIFVSNNYEVNTQTLANYLPDGDFFRAKNIDTSNFRALLRGLTKEFSRLEAKIAELANEFNIPFTYNLIEQWENALGIPDLCFKVDNKTIEFRRKQCIAKLALMNLTTTVDFIYLAKFFDVTVEIFNGAGFVNLFPLKFPILFFDSIKESKFTMIVYFPDIERPSNVFTLTFPIIFQNDVSRFIICLFQRLKPSPVKIISKYKNEL